MINVLIVDDHSIVRDGIKFLLSNHKKIKIVDECNNGKEAVDYVENNKPDVILMDINTPEMNGIDATEIISQKHMDIKIIALTMYNERAFVTKILKAGASGYLLKESNVKEIEEAILTVVDGGNYFSKEISNTMLSSYLSKKKNYNGLALLDDLSKRELQVLKLIATGLTNNRIADQLILSIRTIETHRRNLHQKLGVHNTAGLVKFAAENDLIG
jgi:DNA-binding NarL/FixJ family response regulator